MKKGNFYENIPKKLSKELFSTIVLKNNCKIERIISMGHKTPKGKWYNQNKNEFVMSWLKENKIFWKIILQQLALCQKSTLNSKGIIDNFRNIFIFCSTICS